MIKIALFASGSGTNVESIANFFKNSTTVEVSLVFANNPNAYVLERANKLGIQSIVFNHEQFKSNYVLNILAKHEIDVVVLAGFLWLVPENIIEAFPNRILNIHPALLPSYGGKGMYGDKVHQAVVDNKEKESGITIHLVNSKYDEGQVLFQAKCMVLKTDLASDVASKVHALEYKHFPQEIETFVSNKLLQTNS